MAQILYRDDKHKFSVYRLSDIPDGVPRSGWVHANRAEPHFKQRSKEISAGDYRRGSFEELTVISLPFPDEACCAVLDEHAGSIPTSASPRLAVGMRVVPSARGSKMDPGLRPGAISKIDVGGIGRVMVDGRSLSFPEWFWDPAPTDPHPEPKVTARSFRVEVPTEDIHRERTKYLGANNGEIPLLRYADPDPHQTAWRAHLRFLVGRSEQERRAREPSVGWDPYGDE